MICQNAIILAFFITASTNALILHPSLPPIRHNSMITLNALNNEYDGRPSYRRYQRDGGSGESKNRFNVRNNSKYNTNNEDDAYELARELASRRGLHLSRDQDQPPSNIPMDSYRDEYRSDVPPIYGSDFAGVSEQELPRVPMDYNANSNYNEGYSGTVGGGLKDLTWGGLKEQNDMKKYNERYEYEVRRSRNSSSSMGRRYKPQPPRQPPREVRPTEFRSRNDRMYQSGPSSQRAQASMGRRANNYEDVRRMQQPRQPPPKSRSSASNSGYGSFEKVKRVNKLSELASTSERIDSPARRPMSQYPAPNAQYRPNIAYGEQPPFRPPSTMAGFAPTSEQMRRSSGPESFQFMPPPPYVQMPPYQQQRRQSPNLRPPQSIPLSQLALQPHIQPVDQTSSQQSQSFSAEFSHQQSQPMSGVYNDRRQQPSPSSFSQGRNQSESFGSNPSASFSPLPFQQLSQADFTRPFQGGSQQSQQKSTTSSSNPGAARQPRPDFGGPPPPEFGGPPPQFDQGPPPPPPFGPEVHIFQNPFMNEPMFQQPQTPTRPKPKDDNIRVPKDPNIEKMRRRAAVSKSSSSNNPGSGMKIPKDPLIESRRRQEEQQQRQQSNPQSNNGTKVPKDPFIERQRLQQQKSSGTSTRSQEVRVPKEPTVRNQSTERRPKEPKPKSSSNIRIPREPSMNARRDKIPKEPQRNSNSNVDTKGDDMSYEDFASFFDMPRL